MEPSGSSLGPRVGLWDLRTLLLSPRPPRGALGFKDPIYFEPSGSPPRALLVCLFIWGFMWDLLVLAPSVGPSGSHWPPLGGLGLGGPIEPSGSPLRPQREAFWV